MKLFDPQLEATVLKAICSLDDINNGRLLAHVNEASFYSEEAGSAYDRIKEIAQEDGNMPTWEMVLSDPHLSESSRNFLKSTKAKRVKTLEQVTRLIKGVRDYEMMRNIFQSCDSMVSQLSGDTVDLDAIRSQFMETASELQTEILGVKDQIINIGLGNNSKKLVEESMDGSRVSVIPTGFKGFDANNGGLPLGEAVLMAGPTGGGKTLLMSIQMLLNMSHHANTCLVPLEMTGVQTMQRILANLSQIQIHKFTSGKLSDDEKETARKAHKKLAVANKKRKTKYSIWDPGRDVTMTEVLYSLLPYGHDIILIDYIGLLKGMDTDDQVKALGRAVREAKLFAKNNNKLVIILAQLSDDNKVKYSRAMVEHVSNCWIWECPQEAKESGILTIVPIKSRNQDPTPFDLSTDWSTMRAVDADRSDFERMDEATRSAKGTTARKTAESAENIRQLSRDIEDYDLEDDDDD